MEHSVQQNWIYRHEEAIFIVYFTDQFARARA